MFNDDLIIDTCSKIIRLVFDEEQCTFVYCYTKIYLRNENDDDQIYIVYILIN